MATYSATTEIPRQKLARSKKTKKWAKDNVEAFVSLSRFAGNYRGQAFLEKLYQYYNGQIEHDDYTHVTRPFGETRRNFPAKLHNYNIIKPVVDTLLGEKAKRPFHYTVINTSPDAVSARKQAFMQFARKNVYQAYINELNQLGVQTGQQTEETPQLEKMEEMFGESYQDAAAIRGQNVLDYCHKFLELDHKRVKGFKHFIISGTVATWRGVNYDEPEYEILNPLDIDGDKDPDIEFYEDGDWAVHRKLAYPSSVIDSYYDDLSSEEIARIEKPRGTMETSSLVTRTGGSFTDGFMDSRYERYDRLVEIMRVVWKSRKKVGFVTYQDRFGEFRVKMVQEGYSPGPDEEIEWEWVNEVWEGHRIDGDIYVRCRPVKNQRTSIDNPSKRKLPINGRKYSDLNAENISMVAIGIPYQLSFNIYKYRLDLAVAKSKDRVAQFDINMIPKKWTPQDFLYWVETTGIAFVDYNKEDIKLSPQHQSVMDLTIQTISHYIELLNAIVQEWERVTGVNQQRQGIVGEYAGRDVTQQAIYQGSNITEDLFRKYSRMEQRDLQAILDYSKIAFSEGKKGQYISREGAFRYLDIDGQEHMESEYGVFVSGDGKEVEKLEILKQLIQPMIQNGAPMSLVSEMINSDNFTEIVSKIKKAEKKQAELEQAIAEAEQAESRQQREFEIMKEDREDARNILDNQTDIEVAQIKAGLDEGEDDQEKMQVEREKIKSQEKLQRQQQKEAERSNKAKEQLERMKLQQEAAQQGEEA